MLQSQPDGGVEKIGIPIVHQFFKSEVEAPGCVRHGTSDLPLHGQNPLRDLLKLRVSLNQAVKCTADRFLIRRTSKHTQPHHVVFLGVKRNDRRRVEKAENIIADVGQRIAEIRRERGWTQQDAADKLKMEPQSIQRIERGTNLTIRSLVRIARLLGVPTIALFEPPKTRERRPGRPRKK